MINAGYVNFWTLESNIAAVIVQYMPPNFPVPSRIPKNGEHFYNEL
ncbi:MAG: hypothetical protein WA707_12860 [Pseudolabrys sp.]